MKYFDIPKYKVRPRPGRFLFDRVLILLGLGVVLYLGIYVNYYLLSTDIPVVLNWMFIIGIILLIVLELILCTIRYGNYSYEFFEQKVVITDGDTRKVSYADIKHVYYAYNFVDKWFNTGSIVLELKSGKKVKLKYLTSPNQAYLLMQNYVK